MSAFERRVKRLREHVLSHELEEHKEDAEKVEDLSIDDLNKDEIIEKLEEKGIDHNPKDKKEVLFNLLVGE